MDNTDTVKKNREKDKVKWAYDTIPHLAGTDEFEKRIKQAIKTSRMADYERRGIEWTPEDEAYDEDFIDSLGHELSWRLNHTYNPSGYGGSYGESYTGSQPYGGQDPYYQDTYR